MAIWKYIIPLYICYYYYYFFSLNANNKWNNLVFWLFYLFWDQIVPSKGDRLIVPSGCNTAVTPPACGGQESLNPGCFSRFRSPNSPCESKCFSSSYFPSPSLWLSSSVANALFLTFTIFFYWFVTFLSNVVVFTLILMHQLHLFAFVYFLLDFPWVSYVTSMQGCPLNH